MEGQLGFTCKFGPFGLSYEELNGQLPRLVLKFFSVHSTFYLQK